VGTAYFVSPEMLKWNHSGPEMDYWGLGCILYKMIFGEVPFKGETEILTFNKILE
jgi:3-phosphoinositide dependent protein kinase-1